MPLCARMARCFVALPCGEQRCGQDAAKMFRRHEAELLSDLRRSGREKTLRIANVVFQVCAAPAAARLAAWGGRSAFGVSDATSHRWADFWPALPHSERRR